MNAFEAYGRARENVCPGIEPAPDIENRDNKGIYVRVIEWTAGHTLHVEGKSGW